MTESEAVEKLKNMRLFMQITDENNDCKFTEDDYKANEMAIQALEKQIPKKPITHSNTNRADCPCCGATVRGIKNPFGDWCSNCGQKLDFGE